MPGEESTSPEVEQFLRSAPPEVLAWLGKRAAEVGPTGRGAEGASPADESAGRAVDAAESDEPAVDEDDEGLDLLGEEDDDILQRRRAKKAAAGDAKAGDAAVAGDRPRRRWATAIAAVLALAVGVGGGYLLAKQPWSEEASASATEASDAEVDAKIAELEKTLSKSPEDNSARLQLGVLLFNTGEEEQARRHWEQVIRLSPDSPAAAEAWFDLGMYHIQNFATSNDPADEAAANDAWQNAVEAAPDSEAAKMAQNHLGAFAGGSTSSPSASPPAGAKG